MKKLVIASFIGLVSLTATGQKSKTLLTIDEDKISVDEFRRVYEKNLDAIEDEDAKNIDKYLDLFINYKLKVKQAKALKMDTLRGYKREISSYRNQLASPYLQDKDFKEKMVQEAYKRTKIEVRASHILVKIPRLASQSDTLKYYNRIIEARKRVLAGESFAKVAKEVSEDPSAKRNGGDLGYFSAFRMVYPFEDNAYKTKVGELSMPFRSRFGYHIVKTIDKRPSPGQVQVAHILISDTTSVGETKINEVYKTLNNGANFDEVAKKFSGDKGTKDKGGILPQFGSGMMVPSFNNVAFSLQKEGELSKPVKTPYGWHVLKLIKKIPVLSFKELRPTIEKQIKSSGRSRLSDEAMMKKLRSKYTIVVNDEAMKLFRNSSQREFPKDSMQSVFLTIEEKKFTQEDFSNFIKVRRHVAIDFLEKSFIDEEVKKYFKENLKNTEPAYRNTLQEYEDGLLLFELMQQKVWNKSNTDTLGLQTYFNQHKAKYKVKDLEKIKGEVMNDYQQELERNLLNSIRNHTKIKVNKRLLKKFKKQYNQ